MRSAAAAAGAVVAVTLVDDLLVASHLSHPRPVVVLAGAGAMAVALLVLAPRARSTSLSIGAGIAAGGALATLVTGLAWRNGVPNPLAAGGVAFNLADVAICAGDALLLGSALTLAWTNRSRLREPV
jgi:lipoprotein signal peptidase